MSLRDEFLKTDDQPWNDVDIEGWGLVRVRPLTAGQWMDIFYVDGIEAAGKRAADTTARIVVSVCHDPITDKPIFSSADIEKIKAVPTGRLKQLLAVVAAMRDMPTEIGTDKLLKPLKKKSRRTRASRSS